MFQLDNAPMLKNGKVFKTCSYVKDNKLNPPEIIFASGFDNEALYLSNGMYILWTMFESVGYGIGFIKLEGYNMSLEISSSLYDNIAMAQYAIQSGCKLN